MPTRKPPALLQGAARSSARRSEIFIDVIERLAVTINSSGYVLTSEVDGTLPKLLPRAQHTDPAPRTSHPRTALVQRRGPAQASAWPYALADHVVSNGGQRCAAALTAFLQAHSAQGPFSAAASAPLVHL